MLRSTTIVLTALTLCSALPASAAAAGSSAEVSPDLKAKTKAHIEVARVAYNLGKFEEALASYEAAYRGMPLPALLFNIAQCHRQAGRHDRAIFFFDGYLREGAPGAQQTELVQELIAESRQKMAAQKLVRPPADDPASPPKTTAGPEQIAAVAAAPDPAPSVVATTAASTELIVDADDKPGLHERWWFWVLIGVGVAAAGSGAAVVATRGSGGSELPSGTLGSVDWR